MVPGLNLMQAINLRAISQEMLMNFICNMCSQVMLIKLLPHLPGDKELTNYLWSLDDISWTFNG